MNKMKFECIYGESMMRELITNHNKAVDVIHKKRNNP